MFNSQKYKNIKIIVTDFDGVITDGKAFFSCVSDEIFRQVSFKDIMGISVAVKNGYKVGIISGENNKIIDMLAKKFNLEDIHQNIRQKAIVIDQISEKYNVPLSDICYIGDDINDICVLEKVGLAITVPNANKKVKELEYVYITETSGGDGAFREVVDNLIS